MNLVGNITLGRIVVLSIWHCYCIIKSAASAYASMNPLIRGLPNWDEYDSYPANGIHDWKFWGYLGQAFCKPDEPKSTDKYPSLTVSGYRYPVKGEPLTEEQDIPEPPFVNTHEESFEMTPFTTLHLMAPPTAPDKRICTSDRQIGYNHDW